ncbi:MAG: TMEM175 family protein [Ktedonobacteraceae bacterium]
MGEKETGRLEAFSDGVFAVAITLLILNIKIPGIGLPASQLPNDSGNGLWHTLLDEWPMLAAYITSFATIGVMWLNHHRMFTHIKRINTPLMMLNLLLLLLIVFVPVPTALLAEYLARLDLHEAAILYGGTFFLTACCFNILWLYASYHNRLLGENVNSNSVKAISRQYAFGPLLYLIIFAVAWVNTLACLILSFMLALFFALPGPSLHPLPEKSEIQEEKEA